MRWRSSRHLRGRGDGEAQHLRLIEGARDRAVRIDDEVIGAAGVPSGSATRVV